MNISIQRIRAIMVKDYKEFFRNYAISIMVIFPIVFALMYRNMEQTGNTMFGFVLNFTLAMVTSFVQAALIAEEKERNTLRSLMMTPATTLDVLIGKSALVFAISAVIMAAVIYLFGYDSAGSWAFIAANALSIILYTSIGTICGLFSRTLLETTLTIFPVLIVFTAAPFGAFLADDFPVLKVLEYVPSSQLIKLLDVLQTSFTTGELLNPLLHILIWTVVVTIASVLLYQKRLKDE